MEEEERRRGEKGRDVEDEVEVEEEEEEEEESTGPGQDLLMQQRSSELCLQHFHSEDFSLLFPEQFFP